MGPIHSFDDLLGFLARRGWVIACIYILGAVAAVAIALSRPQSFQSTAVIQVETPVVSGQESDATSQTARLLQSIQQRLTTRDSLLAMIERQQLFSDLPQMTEEQKIFLLRTSISFETVPAASQQGFGQPTAVSALMINAQMGDPDSAARVANDFAQGVLDEATAAQRSRAKDTAGFFETEAARVHDQITTLEAEIAAYRSANPVAGPSESGSDELISLDSDIRRLQQDLLGVQAELAALNAKSQLRETDRRRIETLQTQQNVLQSQSSALELQRSTIEAKAANAPEIERQLGVYQRNLEQLQTQLETINSRKAQAEMSLRLEQDNQGEHFRMLERALAPDYATGSSRRKLAVAGMLGSLILAFGVAFALELMHPVIRTTAQMERELGIRPVISIPKLDIRRQA